ncbi:MAG: tRNA pseudouridine(13) synthase TruD [Planctomycetota bacterium]|nr:tRNA pseudouridine(13) synthase TruD [Planctomycetota bacterium]MDA1113236.1 tRNA pseudouridine(13) synthase TruD [Planctomycetota bacterium]
MRLKRTQNDFRVTELFDDTRLLAAGPFAVYRMTKRGLTTFEAADILATGAGVERSAVAYAGLKDKDGVTSQIMTVEGGKPVTFRDKALTVRSIGRSDRAIESKDSRGNSFEIVLRDLEADDMRRIRVNMAEIKKVGVPNYFDDQRFGCLRHGQGFVARHLLKGQPELALRALLAAPSRYGAEPVEKFKRGIQDRWGNWSELASYCRARRGATVFEHLNANPGDFIGAMERGIATRERTIHLFAYQSYLWNKAAGLFVQEVAGEGHVAWMPCDAGSLQCFRNLDDEQIARLKAFKLPLLGPGLELEPEAAKLYQKVFRAEGVSMEDFLAMDISGFRPQAEERPFMVEPEYLRAAPAEDDEIYRRRRKMRVRFSLPRGHYATLIMKRLCMPTEKDYVQLRMWVARHPLDWPNDKGVVPVGADMHDRRHWSERGRESGYRSPGSQTERGRDNFGDRESGRDGGSRRPSWPREREDREGYREGGDRNRDDRNRDNRGGYRGGGDRDRDRSPAWNSQSGGGQRGGGDRNRDDRGGYRSGGDRADKPVWGGNRDRDDRGGYRDSENRDRDNRGSDSNVWGNAGPSPPSRSGNTGDRPAWKRDDREERPQKSAWKREPRSGDSGGSKDLPADSPWKKKDDHDG